MPRSFLVGYLMTCDLPHKPNIAYGEEGARHNLACLPPGGVSAWSEVGEATWATWLACSTTWVAIHQPSVSQPPDEVVERRARYDVLVLLGTWGIRVTRGIGVYFS